MRERMAEGALKLFRELNYTGAGTIEFLVEGEDFYFMEVNARLQVEHPVSEFVSGVDIVRGQILACAEGRMEVEGERPPLNGWAIECRINALSPGKITRLETPGGPGVRFDGVLYQGCTVPPFYDSMVAKLIVHDGSRDRALAKMSRALEELVIEGISTNRDRQRWIVRDARFRSGQFGTHYYEEIAEVCEHAT
jgi:acetyl-CoA carboxylase biotin carboxylase subunit